MSLHANFYLGSDETFITNAPAVLNTQAAEIYESSEVDEILNNTNENLVSSIEDFQHRGSGWVLDRLLKLDLHILEFNPLRATSYIPLPSFSFPSFSPLNPHPAPTLFPYLNVKRPLKFTTYLYIIILLN